MGHHPGSASECRPRFRERRSEPPPTRARRRHRSRRGSRPDLARAPRNQKCGNDVMRGWRSVSVEAAEEQLGGCPAHCTWILRDDCEARVEQVGQQDVVKPDKPHLVMLPQPSQPAISPDREQVLGVEQGRGWKYCRKHLGDRRLRALDTPKSKAYKPLVKGDVLGRQLL